QRPKALGVRFRIEDGASFPMVDPEALFSAVQRVAKTHRGDKPQLRPESLEMLPVEEAFAEGGIRVLVSAVATEDFRAVADFVGEQLFFVARLDATGLGSVKQLPFFVVHEPGWEKAELEKTTLFLPPKSAFLRPQAFSLGGEALALYGGAAWPDSQDTELGKVGELNTSYLLVVGSPAGVSIFTRNDIVGVDELSSGVSLYRLPWLLGFLGNRSFLFDGRCTKEEDEASERYCPWILSVSP
ncbi:MAG: hypothetical protein ACP5NF_09595, partial [Thermoanaerobaculum sp.]